MCDEGVIRVTGTRVGLCNRLHGGRGGSMGGNSGGDVNWVKCSTTNPTTAASDKSEVY